jgi:TfoX/Sxy family transcriptional regulator of competence genes
VAPTTDAKPKQIAFILTEKEYQQLQELSEDTGRSAASWLRRAIVLAHRTKERTRERKERKARTTER